MRVSYRDLNKKSDWRPGIQPLNVPNSAIAIKSKRFKRFAYAAGTTFFLIIVFGLYTTTFRISRNFYEVDPGRFYRSAQQTPSELEEVVLKYGIRTVINLRGAHEDEWWYKPQVEMVKKLGIKQLDIGFSSQQVPGKEALLTYLNALVDAERPILVHCRSGADRTGEATVMYAMEYMKMDKEKAVELYLNPGFYHFAIWTPSKKFFIREYGGYEWAQKEYDPCTPKYARHYEQKRFCQ